jgi:hypothetical protein
MRPFFHSTMMTVALTLLCPVFAHAQINCGTPTWTHWMRQTPNYARAVDVFSSTMRPIIACPQEVQTETWVNALANAGLFTRRGLYSAPTEFTRSVPSYGTWSSTSRHWLIWTATGRYDQLPTTIASTRVDAPPPPAPKECLITADDCPEGYQFDGAHCNCKTLSPILIDTAGDGYRLTRAPAGVFFDLDANGNRVEQVAWTEPDSDDAWLVFDRNENGVVDSGRELFGSRTPAYADGSDLVAENGFDALLLAEGPTYGRSAPDRVIDARDSVYGKLRLWFDRNHNGESEPGELVPLADAGVLSISSEYKENGRRDAYGNKFSLMGRATFTGPNGRPIERNIYDVFLTVADSATPAQ